MGLARDLARAALEADRTLSLGLSRGGEMHVSLPGKPNEPIDERTLEALRSIGEAALNRMLEEDADDE